MDTKIKQYADSHDIQSLKYIFVDALDIDPTFCSYEEEYRYCQSVPGLLEPHMELTPFQDNPSTWDESYWSILKTDLLKNFSNKRMSHMREVAQVVLADKVQRIRAERTAKGYATKLPDQKIGTVQRQASTSHSKEPQKQTARSALSPQQQAQRAQIEAEKRKLEEANKAHKEKMASQAREREARKDQYRTESAVYKDQSLKKALGIAVAAVAVAVTVYLLLK